MLGKQSIKSIGIIISGTVNTLRSLVYTVPVSSVGIVESYSIVSIRNVSGQGNLFLSKFINNTDFPIHNSTIILNNDYPVFGDKLFLEAGQSIRIAASGTDICATFNIIETRLV